MKAVLRRAKAYERLEKYKEALHGKFLKEHYSELSYIVSLSDFTAACILEGFGNYSTMTSAEQVLKALGAERAKEAMAERGNRPIPFSRTFVDSYLASFAEDPVLNSLSNSSNQPNGGGDDYKESNVTLNGEAANAENLR